MKDEPTKEQIKELRRIKVWGERWNRIQRSRRKGYAQRLVEELKQRDDR